MKSPEGGTTTHAGRYGFAHVLVPALGSAGILLLAAPEARADVAPTPLTIPFLFFFFVVPVLVLLARLLLLGISRLITGGRRPPIIAAAPDAAHAAARVPALGFRVRTWLVVLVLGTAAALTYDVRNYRSIPKKRARRTEVRSNLGAIRSHEVAYFAEWDVYVGNQPLTPVANRAGDDRKVPWTGTTRFSILGFAPEWDVYCSYGLEGPDYPTDGFTAVAHCDLDRDGTVAVYTVNSVSGEIRKTGGTF